LPVHNSSCDLLLAQNPLAGSAGLDRAGFITSDVDVSCWCRGVAR
jgi:hypothetical protein